MKRKGVIYCYHCIFNGKKYIGKSINIFKRKTKHKNNAENGLITKFYTAVRKYGWEGFIFGIIDEYDETLLNEKEIFYISKYNSLNEGYNMTEGGDGGAIWIPSEDDKKRQSERMKGYKHSDKAKKKISEANRGRKWSEEAKKKLREKLKTIYRKPGIMSQESRENLSKMRKGVSRPPEVIAKMLHTRKLNGSVLGEKNPNAKSFIFISPDGFEYKVIGKFKKFCVENNLSLWGMNNFLKTGKIVNGCKGWIVKRND